MSHQHHQQCHQEQQQQEQQQASYYNANFHYYNNINNNPIFADLPYAVQGGEEVENDNASLFILETGQALLEHRMAGTVTAATTAEARAPTAAAGVPQQQQQQRPQKNKQSANNNNNPKPSRPTKKLPTHANQNNNSSKRPAQRQQRQIQQKPPPKKKQRTTTRPNNSSTSVVVNPDDLPPFNDMLYKLLQYRAEHRHCSVPSDNECFPWVVHLRRQYNAQKRKGNIATNNINNNDDDDDDDDSKQTDHNLLTPERFKVLESIGFSWRAINLEHVKLWCDNFNGLLEYRRQHGHCNISPKYSKVLHTWTDTQRTNRRKEEKAKNQQKERLIQELGGEKEYEQKTLNDAKIEKYVHLSTEERYAKLDLIGFDWQPLGPPPDWELRYQELVQFKQEHGHCDVPINKKTALSRWVSRQRYEYKFKQQGKRYRLSDEREKLLNDIGFTWKILETPLTWEARYQQLIEYKNEHGHCDVPESLGTPLSKWVIIQQRQGNRKSLGRNSTMTNEQEALLNKIGFVWKPINSPPPWDEQYELLVEYKKENGHCDVPLYPDTALARWVLSQRRQHTKKTNGYLNFLTDEREAKLKEIGFDFTTPYLREKNKMSDRNDNNDNNDVDDGDNDCIAQQDDKENDKKKNDDKNKNNKKNHERKSKSNASSQKFDNSDIDSDDTDDDSDDTDDDE